MEKEYNLSITYKTSRISYVFNYVLVLLIILLLAILYPSLNLSETISAVFVFISFIVILILFVEPQWERILRRYIITDTEVIKIEGILRKNKISIPMEKIADINLKKGILGRIFNFGNIKITGFKNKIEMKGIRYPEKVYELIRGRIKPRKKED